MLILHDLTKMVGSRTVLSSVNIKIPANRRIALTGPSPQDNHLLINILAGIVLPTSGHVERKAEVSFPVGSLNGVSRDLSVRLNVAHVARLYGADVRQTLAIVESALNIGAIFDKPYGQLPAELRKPLGQIVAFALPFDLYLLMDDHFRAPTKPSRHKGRRQDHAAACFNLFEARARTAGMIVPTNDSEFARQYCDMTMALDRGKLTLVDEASEPVRAPRQNRRDRINDRINRRRLRKEGAS